MKAEDVPAEWENAAAKVTFHKLPYQIVTAIIAAVAPLIAAAEREACAKVAEHFGAVKHGALATDPVAVQQQSSHEIAAAIRADQYDARSDAP